MVVIVVLASALTVRSAFKEEARQKREAAYQSALQAYSHSLPPGLTRKEVETYLRARNVSFRWMWPVKGMVADLIEVGQEDHPWCCSENTVYVAFEFGAREPHQPSGDYGPDVLKRVELFRQLTGCL
jgi:hypothetical protein